MLHLFVVVVVVVVSVVATCIVSNDKYRNVNDDVISYVYSWSTRDDVVVANTVTETSLIARYKFCTIVIAVSFNVDYVCF